MQTETELCKAKSHAADEITLRDRGYAEPHRLLPCICKSAFVFRSVPPCLLYLREV